MQQRELTWSEERRILTVSQVVGEVRSRLEAGFRDIWVRGELSNFRRPGSGHYYFTLKDSESQLKAVCFRMQNRLLKFRPQDGMDVLARGSLSVYEPRGDFQLIVQFMEPMGPGALQIAYEKLKARLKAEGLFEAGRKKPLPLLPGRVAIITSPSGAAIQDFLRVLTRRNDRVNVLLFPVRVQGSQAAGEIAAALRCLDRRPDVDVIVIARGGGSLEDLWAFNEEAVARAIAEARLPVISAVGHETDFTIADFAADLRAPTPSAAAEIVAGARQELARRVDGLVHRAGQAVRIDLKKKREALQRLTASRAFVDAESRLRFYLQRFDELSTRMLKSLPGLLQPLRERSSRQASRLGSAMQTYLESRRRHAGHARDQLRAFSPLAVLERGYAIVSDLEGNIVRDAATPAAGDLLDVKVSRGEFQVRKV